MADMQMRLLRKKIQKRNDKNKKRKLLVKQRDEEEPGKSQEQDVFPFFSPWFSEFLRRRGTSNAKLAALANRSMICKLALPNVDYAIWMTDKTSPYFTVQN